MYNDSKIRIMGIKSNAYQVFKSSENKQLKEPICVVWGIGWHNLRRTSYVLYCAIACASMGVGYARLGVAYSEFAIVAYFSLILINYRFLVSR